MTAYCDYAPGNPLHGPYHDTEYGFPLRDDDALFERLMLEVNQAGLSWDLILRRRNGFREAYDGFVIDRVAAYGDADETRLLADPRVIRNRLKVRAAVENARRLQTIRAEHGSFAAWLDARHPLAREEWVALFRRTFRFTGPEITGEFLMSIGYLAGAHRPDCPVYARIAALRPPFLSAS